MNFASDNAYGVHPKILAALGEANDGTAPSYGGDGYSKISEELLSEVFGREVRSYLVSTGTAANGLALSAIAPGYGAILCHDEAHVFCDECNSPEFFTGGAKLMGHHGPGGKITPAMLEKTLKGFIRGEHDPKPKGVSMTNATELGTVYSPAEVKAISDLIAPRGMKLHMDGARFANAVAGLGCSPADVTWKSGVDVMSFGATKNGAMVLDAVVFFDLALAEDFAYRRMRAGQLISKSRFLGAQMLAYLEDDLWLHSARQANVLARRLVAGLADVARVRILSAVDANIIFVAMPRELHDRLKSRGAVFHQRVPAEVENTLAADEVVVRLVLSYATPQEAVDQFISTAKGGRTS